ncbi:hypothetical protein Mgra_00002556 [Meloidogyne graminicola]|uniref:NIDO domain-containing protein n=1 Tax=Meloidogyne graminicola TaxID=189291 RepID=A0A8S9ZY60_9BILA|nr:hypothetical protein Mgra_00002556 [Meloidogyne graminicola]
MAPDRDNSILLPGSGTEGIEQLSQLSNARSQGIWLYRIDELVPSACLRPELQPPYCDTLSSSLSGPSKTVEKTQNILPPPSIISTTPEEVGRVRGEEEEEEKEGGREQQHLPFSREEQSEEEKQFQLQPSPTIIPKKQPIIKIQSKEFEMPPDAFEDSNGLFVRTTTKTTITTTTTNTSIKNKWEAEQEEEEKEIITPSLIIPEFVDLQKPSTTPTSSLKTTDKALLEIKKSLNIPSFVPIEKTPKIVFDGRFQHKIEEEKIFKNNENISLFPSPPPMQTIWPLEENKGKNREEEEEKGEEFKEFKELNKTEIKKEEEEEVSTTLTITTISSTKLNDDRNNLIFIFNNTKTKPISTTKKIKPTTQVPKHKPENPDGDDLLMEDWGERDSGSDSLLEGVAPNKLSIVVPIAIVLVWLVVLLIVAIFLCCRRRQTQERLRTLYGPSYQIRPVYTMRVNKLDENNVASYAATEGVSSYEEHLEKAAQRLSAELAYNPNPLWAGSGRYSLYGSYWNLSPDGSAAVTKRPLPTTSNPKQQRSSSSSAMEMISSPRSSQESSGQQQQQQSSSVFSGYAQQISGQNNRPPFNSPGEKEQQQTTGTDFHRSQVII